MSKHKHQYHGWRGRFTSLGYCCDPGSGGRGGGTPGSELPATEAAPYGSTPTLEPAPECDWLYCDVDAALDTSFGSSSHDWYAGGSRPDAERCRNVAGPPSWCRSTSSSKPYADGGGSPSRPENLDGREDTVLAAAPGPTSAVVLGMLPPTIPLPKALPPISLALAPKVDSGPPLGSNAIDSGSPRSTPVVPSYLELRSL